MIRKGWIGVDLDGTLAMIEPSVRYGPCDIGKPVPLMVARVKQWLQDGQDVRILTARATWGDDAVKAIEDWCKVNIGRKLPVTAIKDSGMLELYDDRARRVEFNTGMLL